MRSLCRPAPDSAAFSIGRGRREYVCRLAPRLRRRAPRAPQTLHEVTEKYNIPLDAVLGGPDTMYPEYRKTLKDAYVLPPPVSAGAAN